MNLTPTDTGPSPRELMGLPNISTVVEIANAQSPPLPCVLQVGDWIRIKKSPGADTGNRVIPKKYGKRRQVIAVISANTIKVDGDITVDVAQLKKVCPPE
jgi:hypothetical protein